MIVSLMSVSGSPGVSSWSLLLPAAFPAEHDAERVALEADLDGGVFGARYGLGVDPGVVSLIAGLRRSEDGRVPVDAHGRCVSDGVWVVPGPESAEQARRVWTGSVEPVAERLSSDPRVWFVDLGRVSSGDVRLGFVSSATLTVVLTRAESEHLVQVPSRVQLLRRQCEHVAVLVVGKSGHRAGELADFFGTDLVWAVGATDSLVELAGAVLTGGRARRSWVWRSALDIAAEVAAITATVADDRGRSADLRVVGGES